MLRRRKYKRPILLFHWSPVSRRPGILKHGLRINSKTWQHEWVAPYTCFSNSPSLAWALSAGYMDQEGDYDLWMCWSTYIRTSISRRDDIGKDVSEYRVHEDIPKANIWHVGVKHYHKRGSQVVPLPCGTVKQVARRKQKS